MDRQTTHDEKREVNFGSTMSSCKTTNHRPHLHDVAYTAAERPESAGESERFFRVVLKRGFVYACAWVDDVIGWVDGWLVGWLDDNVVDQIKPLMHKDDTQTRECA